VTKSRPGKIENLNTMTDDKPTLTVGVPCETFPGEQRVALVPATVTALRKQGLAVVIEQGAGVQAGFSDALYSEQGARILEKRADVFAQSDVILQVLTAGANPEGYQHDLELYQPDQIVIGMCDPLGEPQAAQQFAEQKVQLFSLELLPRITRAQSMDVLSSMATVAGYKAVLMAADTSPRMFPMMMTAAGTVKPAKVFVMGAGVAGLQAIATAKRLGAVVRAYDIRPVVKEQIESLGGKYVEVNLDTGSAEESGGYAKEMGDEFLKRQQEVMTEVVAESDVVITTAAIPGRKSPILVTAEMVKGMQPGSVIIDLAAERGGNCELTKLNETVIEHGVTILGPGNLSSSIPFHASEMYAKNISTLLLHLLNEGKFQLDLDDEIVSGTLVANGGDVVNNRIRELLNLEPIQPPTEPEPEPEPEPATPYKDVETDDSVETYSLDQSDEEEHKNDDS